MQNYGRLFAELTGQTNQLLYGDGDMYITEQYHLGADGRAFRTRTKMKFFSWGHLILLQQNARYEGRDAERIQALKELGLDRQGFIRRTDINALYTRYNKLVRQAASVGN